MPVVRMPNGDNVRFPDDMPREQIKGLIASKFPDLATTTPTAGNKPAIAAPVAEKAPAPMELSFMERVGQDIEKRREIGQSLVGTPVEKFTAGIGKVGAGIVQDVAGEAVKSAVSAIPEGVKQGAKEIAQQWVTENPIMAKKLSTGAKFGLEMAAKGADTYRMWAKQNPRIAQQLESVVNVAMTIPVVGATGKAAELTTKAVPMAAKATGEITTVRPIAKGLLAPSEEKLAKTTQALHSKATATIESAKDSGVKYDPQSLESLSGDLDNIKQLSTAGERSSASGTVAEIEKIKTAILGPMTKAGERDISLADTSLRNLIGFSNKLGELSKLKGAEGAAARTAKGIVDDAIQSGKAVEGDVSAIGKVADFKKEWGTFRTHETLANILQADSAKEIRNRMRSFVDSKYFKSLDPEVQRLAKRAATGTVAGHIYETAGKLRAIIGGGGVVGTGAVGAGLSLLAGNAAPAVVVGGIAAAGSAGKQIAKGTVADILKAIQEGK